VNFGDVVDVDFGDAIGSEAGFRRPSVVVVADAFLRYRPSAVYVVPLTPTPRRFPSRPSSLTIWAQSVSKIDTICAQIVEWHDLRPDRQASAQIAAMASAVLT